VLDHVFGNAFERQTVDASTETLFDGPNGAFDLANVTVSGIMFTAIGWMLLQRHSNLLSPWMLQMVKPRD